MRRDNLIRMLALIALCTLVYYFSFDQGREAMRPKIAELEDTVAAKNRIIEKMALDVNYLKQELTKARASSTSPEQLPDDGLTTRVELRIGTSKILFEARLVLTCLQIDHDNKTADLQINLIQDGKILTEHMGLGQNVSINIAGQGYTVILEQIRSTFVVIKLVRM